MNEMDNKWIGKNTIRPDGADKVTGRAEYAADTIMPGMIWGKVLRRPYPHPTIKSINKKKPEEGRPGVCFEITIHARNGIPAQISSNVIFSSHATIRLIFCGPVSFKQSANSE